MKKKQTKKPSTLKIQNRHELVSRLDLDFAECYNPYLTIVPSDEMESFQNLIVSLYENKQLILMAEAQ